MGVEGWMKLEIGFLEVVMFEDFKPQLLRQGLADGQPQILMPKEREI